MVLQIKVGFVLNAMQNKLKDFCKVSLDERAIESGHNLMIQLMTNTQMGSRAKLARKYQISKEQGSVSKDRLRGSLQILNWNIMYSVGHLYKLSDLWSVFINSERKSERGKTRKSYILPLFFLSFLPSINVYWS